MGSYLTGTIGTRYLWFNGRMGAMTSPARRTAGDYAEPVAQARNITAHSRVGTRGCTKVTKVTIVPEVSFEKRLLGDEEEPKVGRLKRIHLFASYPGEHQTMQIRTVRHLRIYRIASFKYKCRL